MDYDLIVIGGGAAGEAATTEAAQEGARVAIVERDLLGGECSFWACLPSKVLLDAASRRAIGADVPWSKASDRRDWMIAREGADYPSDEFHVARLPESAELVRGVARVVGRGRVEVAADGSGPRTLEGKAIVVATGSVPVVPPIEGLREAGFWTSREATAVRDLPSSVVVMGGGPIGVEMAQVYARFGSKVTLVEGMDRIMPRDHARNAEVLSEVLREDGVEIRTGVMAKAVRPGGAGRIVELSDGSSVVGAELVVAVGRRAGNLRDLGVEEAGVELSDRGLPEHDEQLRIGDGAFIAGDAAGGMQFTHVADYEGRVAAHAALGQPARLDLSAVPRCTFTDPEAAAVGFTVEEAAERGIDAFETTMDYAHTSRGMTIEGARGHVTAVVDRERGTLAGTFATCPGASELIHEAVLAIKQGIPVSVLADVVHGYPTGSRVFGGVVAEAAKKLRTGYAGHPGA